MKNIFFVIACLVFMAGLSGCGVHVDTPDRVTIHKNGDVTISDKDRVKHKGSHGHFCPPGQAKKGNCQ